MALQVIGVGWGRTGTLSLKHALEALGFGPCYHMSEFFRKPEHLEYWQAAADGQQVNWDELFAGYGSAVDYPTSQYWQSLRQYYPDAKFVLTMRDADDWYESVKSTLYSAEPDLWGKLRILTRLPFSKRKRQLLKAFKFVNHTIWENDFAGHFETKTHAIKKYQEHIDRAKTLINQEQLLLYDIESGWSPLCEFLQVTEPKEMPFPHLNKRDEFAQTMAEFL